jgi:predicted P-loop ATPase
MAEGFEDFTELTEAAEKSLFLKLHELGLRPSRDYFRTVVDELARRNGRHPVREYLSGLTWDSGPRLDNWLSSYLGAEDTPLNRAYGRKFLLAAVRRVRKPGCKFDQMLVLESPQGQGKSTALEKLASPDFFTDTLQLDVDPKVVIEQATGKWIVEASELGGLAKRDVESLKALLSRKVDRARLSYARRAEDVPRQFVLAGTTNTREYLRDDTGNRRFWPVTVSKIDLAALERDRDQLWAKPKRPENV